jgi:hypothetical protein
MQALLTGLLVFLIVLGVGSAIAGIVYVFLRLRAGESVRVPLRFLFRIYLYLIIVAGLILLVQGLSALVQAGLGAGLGKDFSYRPVPTAYRPPPPERKGEEVQPTLEEQREQKERGLDRAMKEGLLNGVSFTVVGFLIWAVHIWGRRRLETEEERHGILNRVYLILVLIIFSIIAISSLPQAVYDTLRFYLLTPLEGYVQPSPPGQELATALVALPLWIIYLTGVIRASRRQAAN